MRRKILALVLAMMMVLAMGVAAFAENEEADTPKTHTITITAPAGHTYEVYQVFKGTYDSETEQLNSLVYGQNAKTGTEDQPVSIADMTDLAALGSATYANDQAKIAAYEKYVDFSNPIATVASATATSALPEGWYVIKDKDNTAPAGEGVTLYMFQVLNDNLTISAKSDKPSSEKNIDEDGEKVNVSDYNVGDTIKYELTFTLPGDYANFKKYYVKFKDTLSSGLTYNGDAKIFYGEDDTAGDAIAFGSAPDLAYEIMDLKTGTEEQKALEAGDVIRIEYTCYLNDKAVIGNEGNNNTYKVEFSRNPNEGGEGKPKETSETPEDTVVVFTYETVFDKVDENGAALEGADFKLEKKVDGQWVDVTTLGNSTHPSKTGTSANKDTTFTFSGLDAGEYRLTETYTPAGYNTIEPVEFTITAVFSSSGEKTLVSDLTATDLEMTTSANKGTLLTSIENKSGVQLPSTGGMGTTIFYVVGSVLVLAAAVLLVTKRRMGADK